MDDIAALVGAKRGRLVSVCLPARNEAATIGGIVECIRGSLATHGLVDEILVIDDGSTDATASLALAAGATVVRTADVLADQPAGSGKGNALWAAIRVAVGDLLVFCDADLKSFSEQYVTRLVTPLLVDPVAVLVKAYYDRPTDAEGVGGGRTTELLARPLFALLFPELALLRQPLSGEFAARADVLRGVGFVQGYGVEVGLLIDLMRAYGSEALVQVDLGVKRHRHRSLEDLAAQATEIAAVILGRAHLIVAPESVAVRFQGDATGSVEVRERPPWVTVDAGRP